MPEPFYNIRYAELADGIYWHTPGRVALDLRSPGEGGIGRPCVVPGSDLYRMWFSFRAGAMTIAPTKQTVIESGMLNPATALRGPE
jgi:hypothetical protein